MIDQIERQMALAPLINAIENVAIPKGKVWGFDGEAGLGKTTTMVDSLYNLAMSNPNFRVLIVTPFVKDNPNVSHISEQINKRFGYDVAFAVDSKNVRYSWNQIQNSKILVITHERFKLLLSNPKERKRFLQGRDLTIIDEMPQFIEIYKMTIGRIQDLELILPKSVLEEFQLVVGPIRDVLISSIIDKGAIDLIPHPDLDKLIADVIKVIECSYKEYIKDLNVKKHLKITTSALISEMSGIKEFYNKPVITSFDEFGGKAVTTYDSSIDYRNCGEAIIMAADLAMYNSSEWNSFVISNTARVADFSKWTLRFCPMLTGTSTSILKYGNYYEEVSEFILRNVTKGDKLAIAGNKDQLRQVESHLKNRVPTGVVVEYVDIYNMVGSNDYGQFNKELVLSLPIKPSYCYAHMLQYFENEKLERVVRPKRMSLKTAGFYSFNGKGKAHAYLDPIPLPSNQLTTYRPGFDDFYRFNFGHKYLICTTADDAFDRTEKIEVGMIKKNKRMSMIASEIEKYQRADQLALLYQIIMRVDRQKLFNTEVFMLFSSDYFGDELKKYMRNVNVVDDIILNLVRANVYNNKSRMEQSLASKLVEFLENLPRGEYYKSDIRRSLGINSAAHFSQVINFDLVKEYMKRRKIKLSRSKIIINDHDVV